MTIYIPCKGCNWTVDVAELTVTSVDDKRRYKKFKSIAALLQYLLESDIKIVTEENTSNVRSNPQQ